MFDSGVTGGIFQDVGGLQPNTTYNLTVAIGSRADRINSPGIISLINGTNNTGVVLATGGGLPATQNSWQNYTVSFTTGPSVSGDLTVELSVAGNGTIQADFDNVQLSTTPVPVPPAMVSNYSFEFDATTAGGVVATVPADWTAFNEGGPTDIGSQNAGGTDYTVHDPLSAPADRNQYCYINMFVAGIAGGIYQDVGALQPNTDYTLTVAIGSRADRLNSPGIISLINGTNNNGTLLASGGGLPAAQDSWQDYSVNFTTGASVSGDLTVELSVEGNGTTIQGDFDNVQLTAMPVTVAAPPSLSATSSTASGAPPSLVINLAGLNPGLNYTLQSTTNLTAHSWATETNFIATQGIATFTYSTVGQAQKFYRIVLN
jgi:hypothetical protein